MRPVACRRARAQRCSITTATSATSSASQNAQKPSAALGAGKGHGGCYVTHWFRPTPYAFEDCKAVGAGSVADCVAALDRYVASYPKAMTNEEVGMTLGIIPPHEERYKVAAE